MFTGTTFSICLINMPFFKILLFIFSLINAQKNPSIQNCDDFVYTHPFAPHNLFSSSGRLSGVERVALRSSAIEDTSSASIISIRCGGDSEIGEFVILLTRRGLSPHLHYNNFKGECLLLDDSPDNVPFHPIGRPFPSLLLASAGNTVDSSILLRRMEKITLSIYDEYNGGACMRSSYEYTNNRIEFDSGKIVSCDVVARKISDMIHDSTQIVGSGNGRMLGASGIVIGKTPTTRNMRIWRIDPTGQFWSVDACAIGRGALTCEQALTRRIMIGLHTQRKLPLSVSNQLKNNKDKNNYLNPDRLSNLMIKEYLSVLSYRDALDLACRSMTDFMQPLHEKELEKKNCNNEADVKTPLSPKRIGWHYVDPHGIKAFIMRFDDKSYDNNCHHPILIPDIIVEKVPKDVVEHYIDLAVKDIIREKSISDQ